MPIERRAAIHAALAEPPRLAVVDALALGDASPGELGTTLGLASNLLAHHLRVLQDAGVIERTRSEADRRRTYVRLVPSALAALTPAAAQPVSALRVVFVCTRNSARSQLAAALWTRRSRIPAASAGTHPAAHVHRRAITAARRHGLVLDARNTAHIRDVLRPGDLVVAVCDNAYEHLHNPLHDPLGAPLNDRPDDRLRRRPHLHWSVPDPVRADTDEAFEIAFTEIESRIDRLHPVVAPSTHAPAAAPDRAAPSPPDSPHPDAPPSSEEPR